jgi:hypothetical protein
VIDRNHLGQILAFLQDDEEEKEAIYRRTLGGTPTSPESGGNPYDQDIVMPIREPSTYSSNTSRRDDATHSASKVRRKFAKRLFAQHRSHGKEMWGKSGPIAGIGGKV